LLRLQHGGQWQTARRADNKPFSLMIPGVAAAHDYGIPPTPHSVLEGAERRASVTIFFAPALSGNREIAQRQLGRWICPKHPEASGEIFFAE
jgi:hypothetical protein